MATLVTCTIDPGGTGDYTSWASAESAYYGAGGADLVTLDKYVEARCICTNGSADSNVTCNGMTTDASHTIKVYVDPNYRHSGTWPSGNVYRIEASSGSAVLIEDDYYTLEGIAVRNAATASNSRALQLYTGKNLTVKGGLFLCDASGGGTYIAVYMYSDGPATVYDSIIYSENGKSGSGFRNRNADVNAFNVTSYEFDYSFYQYGTTTFLVKNCLGWSSGTDWHGTYASNSTNNAGHANTPPGSNPLDLSSYTESQVFKDPTNNDFHLCTGSPCIDAGIGPASDSDIDSTDIDWDSRSGTTCDIGADEYSAGAPSYEGIVSETFSLADTSTATATITSSVSETLSLSEAASGQGSFGVSVSENLGLGESVAGETGATGEVTESLVLSDSPNPFLILSGFIEDGLMVTDTAAGQSSLLVLVTDSLALSDAASYDEGIIGTVVEGVAFQDSAQPTATIFVTVSENLNLQDIATAIRDTVGAVTEQVAFTSSGAGYQAFFATVSETLTLGDSLSSLVGILGTVTEELVLSDSPASVRVVFSQITDEATFSSAVSNFAEVLAQAVDGVVLEDSSSGATSIASGSLRFVITAKYPTITVTVEHY